MKLTAAIGLGAEGSYTEAADAARQENARQRLAAERHKDVNRGSRAE